MPEIYRLHGIKIFMNNSDHNPPHVHVTHGGNWASFEIKSGKLMAGKVTKPETHLIKAWIALNKEALLDMWNKKIPIGKL